jgi:hypothetical protein
MNTVITVLLSLLGLWTVLSFWLYRFRRCSVPSPAALTPEQQEEARQLDADIPRHVIRGKVLWFLLPFFASEYRVDAPALRFRLG